jgi:hypothetical protein
LVTLDRGVVEASFEPDAAQVAKALSDPDAQGEVVAAPAISGQVLTRSRIATTSGSPAEVRRRSATDH